MKTVLPLVVVLVWIGAALSCGGTAARATKDAVASEGDSADTATTPESGGTVGGTGGALGSGGRATGGVTGTGGAAASGGVVATGGTAGSRAGGTTGTAGVTGTGTGGSTSTGGGAGTSTGGIAGTGGITTTGGRAGAGGGTGTGTGGASATGGGTGTGRGGAAGTGGNTATGGNTTATGGSTGTGGTGGGGTTTTGGTTSVVWDFPSDTQGWIGGFADYPAALGTGYDLSYGWAALPAEVGPGGGLRLNGNNHSDDLFMYVMREITDLSPQTPYLLDIVAVIDTNAPADCGGIGGSPGASVYVKIGASSLEPVASLDSLGWLRLDIDKGNQSSSGADMMVVGNLANTKVCPDATYEPKTFTLSDFRVTSTVDGRLWIILGTDSGFEGITTLYYDRIAVTLHATP